jgi:GNAT superfamily N-acetyltransferase
MQYFIEKVDDSNKSEMLCFLKQHENYTLFLLGNFENYGFKISEAPYSGNFKLIRAPNKVVGAFCLTKKGSLLIETLAREPVFEMVLASCLEESLPLTGLIGNWDFCNHFWSFLKSKKIIQNEVFNSKEILYNLDLSKISSPPQSNVRLLTESDYVQWKSLRLDYLKEEGFPNDLSNNQLNDLYLAKVRKKITWGFFLNNKLVSIADLNAKALDLGQVGGVYTIPSFRKKGYSKSAMQQLLLDAKELHSMRKLIIFTGEKNLPAQKLYSSLGANQVGYFSLLFGKSLDKREA